MELETKLKNRYFFENVFVRAINIVAGGVKKYNFETGEWEGYEGRDWFKREVKRYAMHPCIQYVMFDLGYRPHDWHQLLLEYPHRSTTDYNRLAYTRDERAGQDDRQVVTTIGKYLTRHFPDMPDHEIRNVVALFTSNGEMQFLTTMGGIVDAVRRGPHSCMSSVGYVTCDDGEERHPYQVYDPALGWSMAVRINGGSIDGRALVYQAPSGERVFVRSYKRCPNGGYSYSDEVLEAWLKAQGVVKGEWDDVGARMRYYSLRRNGFLMPYLDGDYHNVDVVHIDGTQYVVARAGGDFCADNTDGTVAEHGEPCSDCGDHFHEDDLTWVGVWEDRQVCSGCLEDYLYCYGRRGNQYYQHRDNVVYVESQDEYYDTDYLSDNDIVELVSGEYEHLDNAVEVDGDWYHHDDDDICYDEYNDRHQRTDDCVCTEDLGMVHRSDAWQCAETNNWYSDNIEHIEVDGETYHPDHAPETNNDETI